MWSLILAFFPSAVSFDYISLQSIFVGGLFLQQLAWILTSVQNELEAESRSGQLLSLPNHSLLLFSCGFYPEWSPQLKKDKWHALDETKHKFDFIAHYGPNNDDSDCNVRGLCCERADVNELA